MATEVITPVSFPATSPRRLQRGSRYSAHPQPGPPPSLSNLDSAFQLQEYISQLVRRDPEDIDVIVKLPTTSTSVTDQQNESGTTLQDTPEVDQSCWVYEHLRRLAQDLTYPLITLLQAECTRQTCPEMKAGEWLYLCVAHGNGGNMEVRIVARSCCWMTLTHSPLAMLCYRLYSPHVRLCNCTPQFLPQLSFTVSRSLLMTCRR